MVKPRFIARRSAHPLGLLGLLGLLGHVVARVMALDTARVNGWVKQDPAERVHLVRASV